MNAYRGIKFTTPAEIAGQIAAILVMYIGIVAALIFL